MDTEIPHAMAVFANQLFNLLTLLVVLTLVPGSVESATFDEVFRPTWAPDHFVYEGDVLRLKLDIYSGEAQTLIF